MFDLNRETLLTVRQVAARIPGRSGRPIHVSAVYRWIQRGVRGVRLEARRIGGSTYVSEEALERFSDALSAQADEPRRSPKTKRVQQARKELQRHGF